MTDTTDYRTTNAGAYRRGVECAAICEGDTERQRNPYREYTDDWRAFNVGWNAWVGSVLAERDDAPVCHLCKESADPNHGDDKLPMCEACMLDAMELGAKLYDESLEEAI